MTEERLFSVTVRVPASSANLGPGFDSLGIALGLYDAWTVEGLKNSTSRLSISVDGADGVPTNAKNLAYRAFQKVYRLKGRVLPALRFYLKSRIPVAGGLGSSSAAIVGGLVAANAALDYPFSTDQLLSMAAEFEGHPDNVAPALFGGFCVAAMAGSDVRCLAWNGRHFFRDLVAVAAIPTFELKTEKARAVLPDRIPRKDAVFTTGRAALLVSSLLARRFDLLRNAMEDRLHQPYRKKLIPGFEKVVAVATAAGAYGAALSGAGPTILALTPTAKAKAVGMAMVNAFRLAGVQSRPEILKLSLRGARVMNQRKIFK